MLVDQATAQEDCKRNGGHLAAYISLEEQAEVEQFYTKRGFLLPKFHQIYWMGLRVNGSRPKFGWLDPTVDPPSYRTYSHWGTNATTNMTEPQEQTPPESCGAARYYLGFDTPFAWGWADEPCNQTYIFMCRITRAWRRLL